MAIDEIEIDAGENHTVYGTLEAPARVVAGTIDINFAPMPIWAPRRLLPLSRYQRENIDLFGGMMAQNARPTEDNGEPLVQITTGPRGVLRAGTACYFDQATVIAAWDGSATTVTVMTS